MAFLLYPVIYLRRNAELKHKNEATEVRKTSIGGQALLGGIMMKSPTGIAMSVRKDSGEVCTSYEDYTPWVKRNKFFGLPIVRGCVTFVESLVIGSKMMNKSAEVLELDDEMGEPSKFEIWLSKHFGASIENVIMGVGMVLGVLLAVGLFIVLPSFLASFFSSWLTTAWQTNLIEGVLRMLIFLGYLVAIAHMKEIKEVFKYHGAEHKTIACYEHGLDMTVENARKQSRLHPRCGTNYLFLVMMVSIIFFSLIGYNGHWVGKVALRILMLPVVAGLSYEVLRWAGMYDNFATRIVRWPGMKLQLITTAEPDDAQLAVAIEAFEWALEPSEAKEKEESGYYTALYPMEPKRKPATTEKEREKETFEEGIGELLSGDLL